MAMSNGAGFQNWVMSVQDAEAICQARYNGENPFDFADRVNKRRNYIRELADCKDDLLAQGFSREEMIRILLSKNFQNKVL